MVELRAKEWSGHPSAGWDRPLTAVPECVRDSGSWCAKVYGWSHSDLLARSADLVVDRGLSILLILVLALVTRALLHRTINRLVSGASNGRFGIPTKVTGALGRRAPAGLREMAAPLLSARRLQRATTIGSVLRSVVSVIVLIVAAIMVMAEFGLNLAPVLASAGIVGVAIGFGAQNLVRDFLSGMFMLLEDQYGMGDVVDLGEASGTVEAVGLRITTVRDTHGTLWYVRNGAISRVGNKSQGYAVAVVDVPLAHNADTTRASELAGEVVTEVAADANISPLLLEPPQVLGVDTVTMEGILLRVTAKVQPGQQWTVQRALNAALSNAFDQADLPRPSSGSTGPAPSPTPVTGPPPASDDAGSAT